jgi:PncC family amidohydrolase
MLIYVQDVVQSLAQRNLTLAVAEGDTGGLLLERLTAVPGSSAVILGGVVAYADTLKSHLLEVSPDLLRQHGAVSAAAAEAMAAGVRRLAGADIGLATTGIAGPHGATPTKPLGLAYVAAASAETVLVREHQWNGDRQANRQSSAEAAVALLHELLDNARHV